MSSEGFLKLVDEGYAVLWDVEDERKVKKEFATVQSGKESAETFENKLDRVRNDQTARFELDNSRIEPIKVGEPKQDLIVNTGLGMIARLIAGQSTVFPAFMAAGTGLSEERPADTRLAAELTRVSMVSSGFIQATGTTVNMAGHFPSVTQSATVVESGSFDVGTLNSGNMFHRTVLPTSARVDHVQNRTLFSLLQKISQISVS